MPASVVVRRVAVERDMSPELPTRRVLLVDAEVGSQVAEAILYPDFPGERLREVEERWAGPREELVAALEAAGGFLESGHWDWRDKAERVASGQLRVVAIELMVRVQGLMAITRDPRPSVLTPGQSVLYVDYLEAAPWNQRAPEHP